MPNTRFYWNWNMVLNPIRQKISALWQICLPSRCKLRKAVGLFKPELPESVTMFFAQFDGQTLNFMTFEDCKCLKRRILFRVLSMFNLKWRNVLFAKDHGKGNFPAVTYWKSKSIQVSRRKEALFTEGTLAGKQLHSRCMKPLNTTKETTQVR